MKRSRFTEEQVISSLREHEAGHKTADLCRKHGTSSATFYAWKAKSIIGLGITPAEEHCAQTNSTPNWVSRPSTSNTKSTAPR